MSLFSRAALPAALLALAGLATSASAQIVKDGGFESANPGQVNQTDYFGDGSAFDTNWVVGGTVGIDNNDTYVYSGSKSLALNYGFGTDSITQNIATDPTLFYTVSFFANSDVPGSLVNVSFGGMNLAPVAVAANGFNGTNSTDFTQYTFSGLTTASAFSALSFSTDGTLSSGGTLEVDDITVNSSPVPEVSTSLSLGLLLLSLGGAIWTAKKKAVAKTAYTIA